MTMVATILELEAHQHETQRRIERLGTALAAGSDDPPSVRSALVGFEPERERLEMDLARANERARPREDRPEQMIPPCSRASEMSATCSRPGPPRSERQLSARSSTGSGSTKRNGRRSCAGIVCRGRVMRPLSWWRWEGLDLRHGAYETPALPLSYTARSRRAGTRTG